MSGDAPGSDRGRSAVLVVEDEPALSRALCRVLGDRFDVVLAARSVAEALVLYERHPLLIDVVVADIGLPDGDGLDLVTALRLQDPSLGAVVATGVDRDDVVSRAVALGVQGYLHKPFEMNEARINVENARRWRRMDQENRAHRDRLEHLVRARTAELSQSRSETIRRLAVAAERRDPETGNHLERMSAYSAVLARRAGLTAEHCERIRLASPMHDIGKIGIPDEILNHDGPFDEAQRQAMRRHTVIGHEILDGSSSVLLQMGAAIARSHHEWWNGSGYPDGLVGEDIPLEGRIVAIADVFDALLSARRYKPAFTVERTVAMLAEQRAAQFDPRLLDLFLDDVDELLFIRDAFTDDAPLDLRQAV